MKFDQMIKNWAVSIIYRGNSIKILWVNISYPLSS